VHRPLNLKCSDLWVVGFPRITRLSFTEETTSAWDSAHGVLVVSIWCSLT
jgi:hypothetical protein